MSGFASSSEASRSAVAAAATSSPASTVSSIRRPTRTADTPEMPRWPRLPSTARPWGSRIPAFGRTLTANRNWLMTRPGSCDDVLPEVAIEAGIGDPLERLDVARPRAGDDVGWELRPRRRLVPRLALQPVADELLVVARLRAARRVRRGIPEPRRVGRQDLVDEDQLAVG